MFCLFTADHSKLQKNIPFDVNINIFYSLAMHASQLTYSYWFVYLAYSDWDGSVH